MITVELFNPEQQAYKQISLPMSQEKLIDFSLKEGKDFVVSGYSLPLSPSDVNVFQLNEVLTRLGEENLRILLQEFDFDEIYNGDPVIIVNFNSFRKGAITYNDYWKGYLLNELGLFCVPFSYPKEAESYIDFKKVWREAVYNGWASVFYQDEPYLITIN